MRFFDLTFFTKYTNSSEPILEPLFRALRFGVMANDLRAVLHPNSHILDFGCGPEAQFLQYLEDQGLPFHSYVGYDPLVNPNERKPTLKKATILSQLKPLKAKSFDVVTLFAVLEHLAYPDFDFQTISQLVKPGGLIFVTTPSPRAKPILEFLSYKLGIVSRREIEEHTHYFTQQEIWRVFQPYGFVPVRSHVFELGCNTAVVLKKVSQH